MAKTIKEIRRLRTLRVVVAGVELAMTTITPFIEKNLHHDLKILEKEASKGNFKKVRYFGFCLHTNLSAKSIVEIFRFISPRVNLQEVLIGYSSPSLETGDDSVFSLPAQALAVLCQGSPHLREVATSRMFVDGSREDFMLWATALNGFSRLNEVFVNGGPSSEAYRNVLKDFDDATLATNFANSNDWSKWDPVIKQLFSKCKVPPYIDFLEIQEAQSKIFLSPETSRILLDTLLEKSSDCARTTLTHAVHQQLIISPYVFSVRGVDDITLLGTVYSKHFVDVNTTLEIDFEAETPAEDSFLFEFMQQNDIHPPKFRFHVRHRSSVNPTMKSLHVKLSKHDIDAKLWFSCLSSTLKLKCPELRVRYSCLREEEKRLYFYKCVDRNSLWDFNPHCKQQSDQKKWTQLLSVLNRYGSRVSFGENVVDLSPTYNLLSSTPAKVVDLLFRESGKEENSKTRGLDEENLSLRKELELKNAIVCTQAKEIAQRAEEKANQAKEIAKKAKENANQAKEIEKQAEENAKQAKEIAKQAEENAKQAKEIAALKARLATLTASSNKRKRLS